jgi:hypothetical protein
MNAGPESRAAAAAATAASAASAASGAAARHKEALRQQMLLRALWRDARPGVVAGWMRDGESFARGLQAYQANAGALAERALAAAYPTVMQLLGDESFAGMARAYWHHHAPVLGDVARWGAELPTFIQAAEQLAEEPYLADVARLDWAVHMAQSAADGPAAPQDLALLASADPATLWLHLQPGTALVVSAHPVVAIWQAHHLADRDDTARFAPVRQALAEQQPQAALVWRQGWRVQVQALAPADLPFVQAVLRGLPMAQALAAAGAGFNFETWFIAALQGGWLAAAALQAPPPGAAP